MKTSILPKKSDKKMIKYLLEQLAKLDMMYLPHEEKSNEDKREENRLNEALHKLNVVDADGIGYDNLPKFVEKIIFKVL